jgi:hypothetical protein
MTIRRASVVAVSVCVAFGALAGTAAAKTVPDGKYVKSVCSGIHTVKNAFGKTGSASNAIDTSDPVTFQTQEAALIDGLIVTIKKSEAKLNKLSPSDGGKKVTKLFDAYLKAFITKLTDAVTAFRAADPNGVGFQGAVTQLQVAINIIDVGVEDPFSKVKDNGLLQAFHDEKSCSHVVTVFGG